MYLYAIKDLFTLKLNDGECDNNVTISFLIAMKYSQNDFAFAFVQCVCRCGKWGSFIVEDCGCDAA